MYTQDMCHTIAIFIERENVSQGVIMVSALWKVDNSRDNFFCSVDLKLNPLISKPFSVSKVLCNYQSLSPQTKKLRTRNKLQMG